MVYLCNQCLHVAIILEDTENIEMKDKVAMYSYLLIDFTFVIYCILNLYFTSYLFASYLVIFCFILNREVASALFFMQLSCTVK